MRLRKQICKTNAHAGFKTICGQDHPTGPAAHHGQEISPLSRRRSGGNAAIAAARETRAVGDFIPVHVVPGSIDRISANLLARQ